MSAQASRGYGAGPGRSATTIRQGCTSLGSGHHYGMVGGGPSLRDSTCGGRTTRTTAACGGTVYMGDRDLTAKITNGK